MVALLFLHSRKKHVIATSMLLSLTVLFSSEIAKVVNHVIKCYKMYSSFAKKKLICEWRALSNAFRWTASYVWMVVVPFRNACLIMRCRYESV